MEIYGIIFGIYNIKNRIQASMAWNINKLTQLPARQQRKSNFSGKLCQKMGLALYFDIKFKNLQKKTLLSSLQYIPVVLVLSACLPRFLLATYRHFQPQADLSILTLPNSRLIQPNSTILNHKSYSIFELSPFHKNTQSRSTILKTNILSHIQPFPSTSLTQE